LKFEVHSLLLGSVILSEGKNLDVMVETLRSPALSAQAQVSLTSSRCPSGGNHN
jgi:hypothetical protein